MELCVPEYINLRFPVISRPKFSDLLYAVLLFSFWSKFRLY